MQSQPTFFNKSASDSQTVEKHKRDHQTLNMANNNLHRNFLLKDAKIAIRFSLRLLSHDKNYAMRSEKLESRRRKLMLSKILRVDHAGEVGADRIYAGQMAVLGSTEYGPIIKV